jgi:predicted DNA-binding protein (MmcQ/YjbR family)
MLGRAAFAKYVTGLPGATVHEQWESLVAKVGGKVFALRGEETGVVVFKVSETAFEGLTTLDGIGQAAYFAKRQWVSVARGADLPLKDLKAYIAASHRLVASKLTRRLRTELGLDGLLGER